MAILVYVCKSDVKATLDNRLKRFENSMIAFGPNIIVANCKFQTSLAPVSPLNLRKRFYIIKDSLLSVLSLDTGFFTLQYLQRTF